MLPVLRGVVERRLLVNYRVDPEAMARVLPDPFRPQIVGGFSVAGICLIRLARLRPAFGPMWGGMRSENAAHRVAVEWDTVEGVQRGVYIPRRDTDSWVNTLVGGRLFPGQHHRARFAVAETADDLRVGYASMDGSTEVEVRVGVSARLSGSRLFADLATASAFFEEGDLGYSATRRRQRFDGLRLRTEAWTVEPATVIHARSSFFEDTALFPAGSAELDCALVMRSVPVRWEPVARLDAQAGAVR